MKGSIRLENMEDGGEAGSPRFRRRLRARV
jgi:hypothetical protein